MWTTPYVIIRPKADGTAQVVHTASDIKRANYLLTYVSEPGDAMFQTPLHPKSGGVLKYSSHLVQRGSFSYAVEEWREKFCGGKNIEISTAESATVSS